MATIKLTNNVLLDSESVKIGIDVSNKLSYVSQVYGGASYTATQDCWVIGTNQNNQFNSAKIDNTDICNAYSNYWAFDGFRLFLRKGQKFQCSSGSNGALFVYGTK